MPERSRKPSSSVRAVARNPSLVPAVLRAMNASTMPLAWSSHGRSSTTIRIGVVVPDCASSSSAAWESVIRSGTARPLKPEGTAKSRALLFTQPAEMAVQQREQQLVQGGEADVRLELGAGRAKQPQPGGGGIRDGRLDQGGLADSGVPGHHERATVTCGSSTNAQTTAMS